MWTLITGQLSSRIFDYLIVKLYKRDLVHKGLPVIEMTGGWFYQEHVREKYNMTGGKRFMLKRDFRNRFSTQSVKVIRNLIFMSHAITTYELGSLLVSLILLIYLIIVQITTKEQRVEYPLTEHYILIAFIILFKECVRIYSLFDIFFIIRPFFYFFIQMYFFLVILWYCHLFLEFILNKISLTTTTIFKYCAIKFIFIFPIVIYAITKCILIIDYENLNNENFFLELIIKSFIFIYYSAFYFMEDLLLIFEIYFQQLIVIQILSFVCYSKLLFLLNLILPVCNSVYNVISYFGVRYLITTIVLVLYYII